MMLTLYYAPGACSLASHIALEEAGADYRLQLVDFGKAEQRGEPYREINPQGRVPALAIEGDGVLTENVAILSYIAASYPAARLLPTEPLAYARALSLMAFFASSVHIAHAHVGRPERYVADESMFPAVREAGRQSFFTYLKDIDGRLAGRDWLGEQYSVCDGYAFVFYLWGRRRELPMQELSAYTAHFLRVLKRPAVQRTLEQEGTPVSA
jgi:glutathione S-transferase